MSLLLEALKKAELAKQQGTATQPPPDAAAADAGLTIEPLPTDATTERPLITRDRLPDITQPLEILSEDLPSAGVRREAPAPSAAASPPLGASAAGGVAAVAAERTARAEAEPEERERLSARQLFEAKESDYNPRRPFFIALGALGIGALAVLGYFLYQIYAPRPSFNTARSTPITTAPAPATPAQAPSAPAPAAQPAPTPITTPPAAGATAAAPAVPAAPQPSPATGATRPSRAAEAPPRLARAPVLAAPAEAAPASRAGLPAIKVTRPEPRIEPGLERAWKALDSGNLALAKEEYLRVLAANPLDRDALLGLAAIDARSQDFESAEQRYLKALELDPRDPYAIAGLIALRGSADPLQAESRLKNLLAQYPDSPLLHYGLGNLYAGQARWSDAQAAYFRAFSSEPENADYAFNLAVSLDQLRQPKLALEYYRRALALAANHAVGFNSAQVETRVRELTR
jgi:tetratricopeptide (TPR) repeat protein